MELGQVRLPAGQDATPRRPWTPLSLRRILLKRSDSMPLSLQSMEYIRRILLHAAELTADLTEERLAGLARPSSTTATTTATTPPSEDTHLHLVG